MEVEADERTRNIVKRDGGENSEDGVTGRNREIDRD